MLTTNCQLPGFRVRPATVAAADADDDSDGSDDSDGPHDDVDDNAVPRAGRLAGVLDDADSDHSDKDDETATSPLPSGPQLRRGGNKRRSGIKEEDDTRPPVQKTTKRKQRKLY